jgi:chromosomal replication initiation ATPase DnaA
LRARDALSDVQIMRLLADARDAGLDQPAAVRTVIAEAVRVASRQGQQRGTPAAVRPLVDAVVASCSAPLYVNTDQLVGDGSGKRYYRARRIAWFVLNDRLDVHQTDIAAVFGRTASTVCKTLAEWGEDLERDPVVGQVEAAARARLAGRVAA